MELADLDEDNSIKEKLQNLHDSIQKITTNLEIALQAHVNKLSLKDKTKGEDPNTHDVKNQLNRIKQYMIKAKQAHERQTIRPKVDQAAAGRFVKHGINFKGKRQMGQSPNKKAKPQD